MSLNCTLKNGWNHTFCLVYILPQKNFKQTNLDVCSGKLAEDLFVWSAWYLAPDFSVWLFEF